MRIKNLSAIGVYCCCLQNAFAVDGLCRCLLLSRFRLLHVCLSGSAADCWLAAVKRMLHVFPSVLFILQTSTNREFCCHSSVAVRRLYVSVPCFLLVCYSLGDLKNRSDIVLRPDGLPDQTEVQIRTWIRSDCKTYHDQHITFVTIGTYLLQIVVNDAIDEWC